MSIIHFASTNVLTLLDFCSYCFLIFSTGISLNPLSLRSCLNPINARFNRPLSSSAVVSLSISLVSLSSSNVLTNSSINHLVR